MEFIRPVQITTGVLTYSNVAEDDADEWDSDDAPYADDVVVMVTTTANGASEATHKVYRSTAGSNNADPTLRTTYTADDAEVFWWEVVGSTNRYKMFNEVIQEQTVNAGGIEVEITPGVYTGSLALLNVSAASVDIVMTSTADGVVYNESFSLTSYSGINNWYAYFFTPIERINDLYVDGLPLYLDATIAVDIVADTGDAAVGALVLGNTFVIGQSLHGSQFGIVDYSRKSISPSGMIAVTAGAYAKRSMVDVMCDTNRTAEIGKQLASVRSTPVVWVGDRNNELTIIYGYYAEHELILSDYRSSLCTLQIEGLT